jgi:acyl carrier protein
MDPDGFREIVSVLEPFQRHKKSINLETDITTDLELDSLAVMNLLMEVEDRFDISIPLNLIPEIRTVGDLVQVVDQLKRGTRSECPCSTDSHR